MLAPGYWQQYVTATASSPTFQSAFPSCSCPSALSADQLLVFDDPLLNNTLSKCLSTHCKLRTFAAILGTNGLTTACIYVMNS